MSKKLQSEAVISNKTIPINCMLAGEWTGNVVTVEYEKGRAGNILTRKFVVKHSYEGTCICWVFNPKTSMIPIVKEEVKLKPDAARI